MPKNKIVLIVVSSNDDSFNLWITRANGRQYLYSIDHKRANKLQKRLLELGWTYTLDYKWRGVNVAYRHILLAYGGPL